MAYFLQAHRMFSPLDSHFQIETIRLRRSRNRKFWNMRGVPEFLQLMQPVNTIALVLYFAHHGDEPPAFHHLIKRQIIVKVVALILEGVMERAQIFIKSLLLFLVAPDDLDGVTFFGHHETLVAVIDGRFGIKELWTDHQVALVQFAEKNAWLLLGRGDGDV